MEPLKFSGLRSEMAKYGHTLKTIGDLINVKEPGISRRFSGQIEWSQKEINLICDYYKKTYEELFK